APSNRVINDVTRCSTTYGEIMVTADEVSQQSITFIEAQKRRHHDALYALEENGDVKCILEWEYNAGNALFWNNDRSMVAWKYWTIDEGYRDNLYLTDFETGETQLLLESVEVNDIKNATWATDDSKLAFLEVSSRGVGLKSTIHVYDTETDEFVQVEQTAGDVSLTMGGWSDMETVEYTLVAYLQENRTEYNCHVNVNKLTRVCDPEFDWFPNGKTSD
ncbi:MAG: hypothetical protein AAF787_11850, partial [Chloroflexota bacterium]